MAASSSHPSPPLLVTLELQTAFPLCLILKTAVVPGTFLPAFSEPSLAASWLPTTQSLAASQKSPWPSGQCFRWPKGQRNRCHSRSKEGGVWDWRRPSLDKSRKGHQPLLRWVSLLSGALSSLGRKVQRGRTKNKILERLTPNLKW